MATTTDSPQFDRDLRSANQEWKRGKDSSSKWSRGTVPSAGVQVNGMGMPVTGSESQQLHVRPRTRLCDSLPKKHHQNFVKMRKCHDLPVKQMRTKLYAKGEITDVSARSLSELPPTPGVIRRMSTSDNFLYSFDRSDTPGKPLTLEVFVKTPTARETEKFIAKEYEILDGNGEALKGRRARRNLRAGGSSAGEDEIVEDEGFELV
ncbi:hypothetical protein OQA88_11905 [Cercophora sp. LCS_1]